MNARLLILLGALLPLPALAQGFAGLGQTTNGYALPERGTALHFPDDHGAHPDFRIEWWYLTANLTGPDGTPYGIQWTLFRNALAPGDPGTGWSTAQAWMGHAALTDETGHRSAMRLARGGTGQAGVTAAPFTAWIDEWRMAGQAAQGDDPLSALSLSAQGADFAYDLDLSADGPLVLHGDAGFSVKAETGQASYYYSQPFYRVSGTLTLPGGAVPVTGQAWLDREWSSQPLAEGQDGWDWFSLHFEDGAKLMAFRLRGRDAGSAFRSGTWIAADGSATPLSPDALDMEPLAETRVAGRAIPTQWRLALPARGVDITVQALRDDAWMDTLVPYWEGPVRVTGSHPGTGYLEMTGYE
ncbi:lipocalin-like domain-containing protein [Rhodovulum adriaticum]|uniref:Putative secreted hydrolase n=1 Tax=Rhodovulum adriaticum TaxID=35804 RepID=A0A4R2NK36_RHOAD|nr:lipocalin-like domain-containing protein [Rhodovulum adriaticum]MBK1635555.1 iron ABC transporter permease [Rhodovulum adriaticum]TCP21811.1 putative secreted hydrolase [Rhodovulum adriaticum]